MTITSFLRALKALKTKWHITKAGFIRCKKGLCPIVAVASARSKDKFRNSDPWTAAEALNLPEEYRLIVDAADMPTSREGSGMRARLLLATRLKEKAKAKPKKGKK